MLAGDRAANGAQVGADLDADLEADLGADLEAAPGVVPWVRRHVPQSSGQPGTTAGVANSRPTTARAYR
jgi:hypothetical protein